MKADGKYSATLISDLHDEKTETRTCTVDLGGGRTCSTAYVPGDCHDVGDGHGGTSTQCDPASLQEVCQDEPSDLVQGHQQVTFHHSSLTKELSLNIKDSNSGAEISEIKFYSQIQNQVITKSTECVQD